MNTIEEGAMVCKKQQQDTDGAIDLERGRDKEGLDSCTTGNLPAPDTGGSRGAR